MATDIETLGVEFDTSGLTRGTEALDKNERAAKKTADAADKLIETLKRQSETFGRSAADIRLYDASMVKATASQQAAIVQHLKAIEAQEKMAEKAKAAEKEVAAFAKGFGIAMTTAVSGAVATLAILEKLIEGVARYQDIAEKTGGSAAGIASMRTAADVAGVAIDGAAQAMNRLSINLSKVDDEGKGAARALSAIGIDVAKFRQLRPEDQMREVGKSLNGYADSASKAAVANALFGRGGAELLPFLKELGSETQRTTYLTDEQIRAADDYADANARTTSQIKQMAEAIAIDTLPVMAAFRGAVRDSLAELLGMGGEATKLGQNKGVTEFASLAARSIGFLIDMADGVIRTFRVVGETIAANVASSISFFSRLGEAHQKWMKLDFGGSIDAIKQGTAEQLAIWGGYGDKVQGILMAPTFGQKLNERLAAINSSEQQVTDAFDRHGNQRALKFSTATDKRVKKEKDAFAELLNSINAKDSGVSPDFFKNLEILYQGYRRGRIGLEDYVATVEKYISTQKFAVDASKAAHDLDQLRIKARGELAAQLLREVEGMEKQNATLEESNKKTREEIELIGLNRAEQHAVLQARNAVTIATKEQELAALQLESSQTGTMSRREIALQRELELLRERGKLMDQEYQANGFKEINAYLDPAKPQAFGEALRNAFGEAGNALAQLGNAFQNYLQQQAELEKIQKELADMPASDKKVKAEIELSKKQAQTQVSAYATMAGAAKGFFKEGTTGYKVLEAAEKAFRLYELAMAAESMAKKIFFKEGEVAANVALNATKVAGEATATAASTALAGTEASAWGITAVVKAMASLPFPFNLAAGAVTLAAVVAVGAKMMGGGGGGGSGVSVSEQRQKTQGTGHVLGDDAAKSESLANTLELLADNSNIALEFSSKMLSTLRSINDGISGMSAAVARSSGLRGTSADQHALGVGSSKSALGFGSRSTELTDSGISFSRVAVGSTPGEEFDQWQQDGMDGGFWGRGFRPGTVQTRSQTIGDVLGGGVQAQGYADLHKEKSSWWGLSKSSWDETQFSELDAKLKKQMTMTIRSMYEGVLDVGVQLGKDRATMEQLLQSVTLESAGLTKISLKGLSGEDVEKELQAVFGALGDTMAEKVIPGFEDFQKIGEGYFETVVRAAHGMDDARFQLEQFGLAAVAFTEIVNKQGDIGAEIVRQSIVAAESVVAPASEELKETMRTLFGPLVSETMNNFEDLTTSTANGIGNIISTLEGSAADLADTYAALLNVRDGLRSIGISGEAVTRSMIYGARDIGTLQEGIDSFFEDYLTDTERLAAKTGELRTEFAKLGLVLPASKDGFRSLVLGIDETTEAGQLLLGKLFGLTGAFTENANLAEQVAQAARDKAQADAEAAQEAADKARQAGLDRLAAAFATLQRSVAAEKKRLEGEFQSAMAAAQARIDAIAKSVARLTGLDNLLKGTLSRFATSQTAGMGRNDASNVIAEALRVARAGGGLPDAADLQDALSVVSQPSEDLYGSFIEYLRAFDKQAGVIQELSDVTGDALSNEQRMLQLAKDEQELLRQNHAEDLAKLDSMLEWAQQQVDAANGTTQAVLTVAGALEAFNKALMGILAPKPTGGTAGRGVGGAAGAYDPVGLSGQDPESIADRLVKSISGGSYIGPMVPKLEAFTPEQSGSFWKYDPLTGQPTDGSQLDYGAGGWSGAVDGTQQYLDGFLAANPQYKVPGFAAGGDHLGGYRMVGETGRELEATGPARIFSASQTKEIMAGGSNADVVAVLNKIEVRLGKIEASSGTSADANASLDTNVKMVMAGSAALTTEAA